MHNNQLISILGRWAENVEAVDLSSMTCSRTAGKERLEGQHNSSSLNLNHIVAVSLRNASTGRHEVWVPCGFRGHFVGRERSTKHTLIFDVVSLSVRFGPPLLYPGDACGAAAVHLDGADSPPTVCAFGGTDGTPAISANRRGLIYKWPTA